MDDQPEHRTPDHHRIDSHSNPNSDPESALPVDADALLTELDSPGNFHEDLQPRDPDLSLALEEASVQRDALQVQILEAEVAAKEEEEEEGSEEISDLLSGIEGSEVMVSELIEERRKRDGAVSEVVTSIRLLREILVSIGDRVLESKLEESELELGADSKDGLDFLVSEARSVCELGVAVKSKFLEYEEMRRKEKKEMENSIVSLNEENRDMGSLLKIAIMEKEAVEKELNRFKGCGEQKRGAILQIAEKGLHKVGFGYLMGVMGGGSQPDQPISSNSSVNSDASDGEEEVPSLASTIEKIMKNLRREVNDLRWALEETRSECAHLQALVDQQAQKISEDEVHIRDTEERENLLSHSVEELTVEITVAGEEITRWREACELEVDAGKAAIRERDKELALLKEELERTRTALDAAANKLQLKEKLAITAMAAQAAAETCLRLADSRSSGLRERIEELTRQLEEEYEHGRRERSSNRRRYRRVCWPWQSFTVKPAAARTAPWVTNKSRRTIPEMEALLRIRI